MENLIGIKNDKCNRNAASFIKRLLKEQMERSPVDGMVARGSGFCGGVGASKPSDSGASCGLICLHLLSSTGNVVSTMANRDITALLF